MFPAYRWVWSPRRTTLARTPGAQASHGQAVARITSCADDEPGDRGSTATAESSSWASLLSGGCPMKVVAGRHPCSPTPPSTRERADLDRLEVRSNPSKENRLAHDGLGADAFRGKGVEHGLVDRLGLPGHIGHAVTRPAQHEKLVGHRAAEPTNGGQGFTRLDPAFGLVVHCGVLSTKRDLCFSARVIVDCPRQPAHSSTGEDRTLVDPASGSGHRATSPVRENQSPRPPRAWRTEGSEKPAQQR